MIGNLIPFCCRRSPHGFACLLFILWTVSSNDFFDEHADTTSEEHNSSGTFDNRRIRPRRQYNTRRDNGVIENETNPSSSFVVGTGIYDMTGPAAQINFMGYAKSSQTGHGIHLRLRSRAFIISQTTSTDVQELMKKDLAGESFPSHQERRDSVTALTALLSLWPGLLRRKKKVLDLTPSPLVSQLDPGTTICFVSVDIGMGSDLLTKRVLERLEELLPEQQQQNYAQDEDYDHNHRRRRLCHLENLSISGTHTHSAPAGFLQYTLYQISSKGFSKETFDTYVESIAQSILRAYQNLQPGSIELQKGKLFDANINRSPTSYLLNPKSERDMYQEDGDTDKTMMQLLLSHHRQTQHHESNALSDETATPVGLINWFSVHGTSMNGTNLLISGDNKGYASYLMEKDMNGRETLPGQGDFVAAFASTNLGDVSPNTAGPRCLDTGNLCDLVSSTCNGKSQLCIASGPGRDMQESTEIIGRKQFEFAATLIEKHTKVNDSSRAAVRESAVLDGTIAFRHSFVDIANATVTLKSGEVVTTCPAALGYGFAAGTTDGTSYFTRIESYGLIDLALVLTATHCFNKRQGRVCLTFRKGEIPPIHFGILLGDSYRPHQNGKRNAITLNPSC
jgi:hypothetical protein